MSSACRRMMSNHHGESLNSLSCIPPYLSRTIRPQKRCTALKIGANGNKGSLGPGKGHRPWVALARTVTEAALKAWSGRQSGRTGRPAGRSIPGPREYLMARMNTAFLHGIQLLLRWRHLPWRGPPCNLSTPHRCPSIRLTTTTVTRGPEREVAEVSIEAQDRLNGRCVERNCGNPSRTVLVRAISTRDPSQALMFSLRPFLCFELMATNLNWRPIGLINRIHRICKSVCQTLRLALYGCILHPCVSDCIWLLIPDFASFHCTFFIVDR